MTTRDEHEQIHVRGSWGGFVAYAILGLLDKPTEELLGDARSARLILDDMTRFETPLRAMEYLTRNLFQEAATRACTSGKSVPSG